jgi:hypothetical protein
VRIPKAYGAIVQCATNLSYRQGIRHFLATSVDLDASGRPLRYDSAVKGPDGQRWEADRTLNGTAWWTLAVSFSNPPRRFALAATLT